MDIHEYESLKPEEQARVFHQTPFKDKGELLLYSQNPEQLVRSLSDEEFYLLAKDLDLEDRTEILRFANLHQILFLSDIECWKRDRISPEGFLTWIETLERTDDAKLLAWLLDNDYEAIVAGFKKIIQVVKPDREYAVDEILGDTPYFTLDEEYFIAVTEENLETVRCTFQLLFENHRGRYTAILEGVMAEIDDQIEEEAYQHRGIRLAGHGFPEQEVAQQIYRRITREEFEKFPRKDSRGEVSSPRTGAGRGNPAPTAAPKFLNYPARSGQKLLFFDEVLLHLRSGESPLQLQEEFGWLCNKVMAAKGMDFSSEDEVKGSIHRVKCYLSLGLESLSSGDIAKASDLIRERWLETIFRWAATQIIDLREEAAGVIHEFWRGREKEFIPFLSPPYETIYRGFRKTIPLCYDSETPSSPEFLRDFCSLQDIERTQKSIHQIAILHDYLFRQWSKGIADLQARLGGEAEPTLFSVIGTLYANHAMHTNGKKCPVLLSPLPVKDIPDFLEKGFETTSKKRSLRKSLCEDFLGTLFNEADRTLLSPLVSLALEHLEEEWSHLKVSEKINPEYISSIRLK